MTRNEYKQILETAIGNEVEAYEFYKGVSEKAKDNNIKTLFRQLAEEELAHQTLLQGFLAGDIDTMHFDESVDYKVSETVDKPTLSLAMKPADAIALAMKNEEEAMSMYAAFAKASTDPGQKKMFQDLSRMEKDHKATLEGYYVNAAFVEAY